MERLIGYDDAVIIDAIVTRNQPLGTVSNFTLDMLPNFAAGHTTSAHDTSFQTAMGVGRAMGAKLPFPEHIWFVTVESQCVYEFSEELAKPVSEAIPAAIETVLAILDTIQ
jgi:hydrogenase maturation protease